MPPKSDKNVTLNSAVHTAGLETVEGVSRERSFSDITDISPQDVPVPSGS